MIRTVLFFMGFWAYQLLCAPLLLFLMICRASGHSAYARETAGRVMIQWSRFALWMAGAKVRVHGTIDVDPDQAALIVSNHASAFDIPILGAHLGRAVGFIAKIELAKTPLVGRWMVESGCVFIDRSDRRAAVEGVEASVEALRNGVSLVIFPEGTRSDGPMVRQFKKGAARIAVTAGVPLIPVALKDTYLLKQKGAWNIIPSEVEMTICPSIPTEGLDHNDFGVIHERVRAAILAELPPEYDRPDLEAFRAETGT